MTYALQYTAHIQIHECIACGAPISLGAEMETHRKRTHETFYCPNGHPQVFSSESDKEKVARLTKTLDAERAARQIAEHNADVLRQKEAALREKMHRVKNGVCPECRRSFTNLRRHMATKHQEGK